MAIAIKNRLKVVVGDITKLPADVVVTAANEAMCGNAATTRKPLQSSVPRYTIGVDRQKPQTTVVAPK